VRQVSFSYRCASYLNGSTEGKYQCRLAGKIFNAYAMRGFGDIKEYAVAMY